MEWIGAPSPRSTAWRTPSRSTTTATTLYPLAAQAATESPTSWFASAAAILGLLIRPCAFAPTAASATTKASTPYFQTDQTRAMGILPIAGDLRDGRMPAGWMGGRVNATGAQRKRRALVAPGEQRYVGVGAGIRRRAGDHLPACLKYDRSGGGWSLRAGISLPSALR